MADSCMSCKFWNQLTTNLQVDKQGIGNAPIAGSQSNANWGQCRAKSPEALMTHLGSLGWGVVYISDWCGDWGKK